MPEYFRHFPQTVFDNTRLIDITKRIDIRNSILSDPYVFLPYTIKEGDRPQDIALFYYEDVKYVWLVYMSIAAIDPYFDWPLSSSDFDNYIIKKYAADASANGKAVIEWTQNTLIDDNIVHYKNVNDDTIITKDTYDLSTSITQGDWRAIRIYDFELEKNEDKRVVNLLDYRYASQAEKELRDLLKNG
jgi:hypothetical protein